MMPCRVEPWSRTAFPWAQFSDDAEGGLPIVKTSGKSGGQKVGYHLARMVTGNGDVSTDEDAGLTMVGAADEV